VTVAVTWARARPVGTAFALAVAACVLLRYGPSAAGLIAAATCAVLVVLSLIDHETHRLPNRIVLPSAALVLLARLATEPEHWAAWVGAGVGAFACLLVLGLAYPAGLGMGDVKLALLLGAALGGAVLTALFLGTLAAGVAGVVLIARDGREARRRAIAFGPFLAFGAIATILTLTP
jgi:leader peptidase (prepilin peptidase)/N-methyltransferase